MNGDESPAAAAGIESGDRIVVLGGVEEPTSEQLSEIVTSQVEDRPGEPLDGRGRPRRGARHALGRAGARGGRRRDARAHGCDRRAARPRARRHRRRARRRGQGGRVRRRRSRSPRSAGSSAPRGSGACSRCCSTTRSGAPTTRPSVVGISQQVGRDVVGGGLVDDPVPLRVRHRVRRADQPGAAAAVRRRTPARPADREGARQAGRHAHDDPGLGRRDGVLRDVRGRHDRARRDEADHAPVRALHRPRRVRRCARKRRHDFSTPPRAAATHAPTTIGA